MQIIEKQNAFLTIQQKFNRHKKELEKNFNNIEKEKSYQKEIGQSFDNINERISEINFLISVGKNLKDCNKTIELIKIIFELSKKLKEIKEIKLSESIINDSISDLLKYTLDANKHEQKDAIVTIQNVTWQEYENIVETIGEASWCRVSYLNGVLQLMSPGINHERIKEGFSLIIQLYCIKNNITCFAFGSSDLKKKNQKTKGKQPDTAFSFFKDRSNPDLAVEANLTSGGIDDLKIYAEIGISEVWMYDMKNGTKLYSLIDKEYQEITASKYLKDLTPVILNEIIQVALKGSINDVADSLDTFMCSCNN